MAKLNSPISFTGKVGPLSVYRMEGVDRPVVRGIDANRRDKIRHAPSFEGTRRTNREMGGRSTTAAAIARTFAPLKGCGGYLRSGALGALLLPVQELDTESEWGQRSVLLSRSPHLLEGFNLSAVNPFEAVVRQPLRATVSRQTLSATLHLPALLPGVNFFPKDNHPRFCLAATLGVVADHVYVKPRYQPQGDYAQCFLQWVQTPWLNASDGMEAMTLELSLPYTPPDDAFTLVLTAGVQMGRLGKGDVVEGVKKSGGARIVAVG